MSEDIPPHFFYLTYKDIKLVAKIFLIMLLGAIVIHMTRPAEIKKLPEVETICRDGKLAVYNKTNHTFTYVTTKYEGKYISCEE